MKNKLLIMCHLHFRTGYIHIEVDNRGGELGDTDNKLGGAVPY